jgi:GT2 family glycosyltransferase
VRPPLSVVIPSRDRPARLEECLEALVRATSEGDEILVVDSASLTTAYPGIASRHGAACIRAPRPGTSLARNVGWRAARHALVAFVDDDARVRPGWAEAMVGAFDDPGVAFVTGSITAGAGPAEGPIPRMHASEPFDLLLTTRGALGASANLALRRTALERVGGFDEDLGPGRWFRAAEDIDLFDRLLLAGERGRYEPSAGVEHPQWRNRREMLRLDYAYGIGMGARLSRLWRTDRRRARVESRDVLWTYGLRRAGTDLAAGYQLGAATGFLRMIGTAVAFPVGLVRLDPQPKRSAQS